MQSYEEVAEEVKILAGDAGAFILNESKRFNINKAERKGLNDFVSYVDLEAEKLIVHGLKKIVPEAGFITEEGTKGNNNDRYIWVVDPLDGTTNFIHGLPPYSISIALTDGDEIVVGIVYVITSGEMFCATKGGGAWLNGEKITVSETDKISEMLVGTGFPYKFYELLSPYMNTLRYFITNTHGVRRMGSAAVDLAYVACGRLDSFFEYNLNPWDVMAGALLIREAGGLISDFDGIGTNLTGEEIVAANPTVFETFRKAVKENMRPLK